MAERAPSRRYRAVPVCRLPTQLTRYRKDVRRDLRTRKDDDLWHGLADVISRHDVTVGVGKGHPGDPGNERADALARHRRGTTMVRFAPVISVGRA
jgi:ribonuclease HI